MVAWMGVEGEGEGMFRLVKWDRFVSVLVV